MLICPAILIPDYCSTEHLTYLSFSIFRTILITVKMPEISIKLVKVILARSPVKYSKIYSAEKTLYSHSIIIKCLQSLIQ